MYCAVNNVKLFVKDEDEGSLALVFMNFWGGSTETWKQVTAKLKDNFRCITYDNRGWGKSEKPETGYSIKSLAKDALALLFDLSLLEGKLKGSLKLRLLRHCRSQKVNTLSWNIR